MIASASLGPEARWLLRRALEAALVALVVAGVLALGGYALGQQALPRALHGLSIPAVAAAVAAAVLALRVVLRLDGSVAAAEEGLLAPAAALVRLRWVALVALLAALWLATEAGLLAPGAAVPLWGGAGALLLANLALALGRWPRRLALLAQLGADALALAWLVHHAGGVANPFAGFLVFHAVLAAVALPPAAARRFAGAVAAGVALLSALEASGVLAPWPLGGAAPGPLALAAAGAAIALLVAGCAAIGSALVSAVGAGHERLDLEREKLRSIIDCMADAVLYVNPTGEILLRNRAAARLWPDRVRTGDDLRVCHDEARWTLLLERLANPAPNEEHPILPVGDRRFEATYARVHDGAGRLRGVVMVARDVTERLEAQALRVKEERMAALGKLAAALAHELNNPLASISIFTRQALKTVPPGQPLADHLGTVLRNADACKHIVKDLLDFARHRPPVVTRVALAELVGDVARTLGPRAQLSGVTIAAEVAEPATIAADPNQLRQVLVNLGLNAIEAMPEGGELAFRAREETGGVRIEVSDTGAGVPEADRERIWSAFYTTKADGTGLGLAVVRDLVRAHGGSIELDSRPGAGSTFAIVLPSLGAGAQA